MKNNIINIQISDVTVNIHVRENPRSKRLSMKLHPIHDVVHLSKPPHAGQNDIIKFLEKSRGWLMKVIQHQGTNIPFLEGNAIPVLGEQHVISYGYAETPSIAHKEKSLHVKGFDPIIVPGLVRDWLRTHAFRYISDTSQRFADQIGKEIGTITIKDTKSRWGSCTRSGNLAYSWRLVLAPESVAEYVCAHEVAHLIEMNHSPRFWKIVEQLCPDYVSQKSWLKANGKTLFKYG